MKAKTLASPASAKKPRSSEVNRMSDDGYFDGALICEKGHLLNDSVQNLSERNSEFCSKCGARAIGKCPSCNARIRGAYYMRGMTIDEDRAFPDEQVGMDAFPHYCGGCGEAYPWTKTGLDVAEELIRADEELSPEEKDELVEAVRHTTNDTPETSLAIKKIDGLRQRMTQGGWDLLRPILTGLGTAAVKKFLGL